MSLSDLKNTIVIRESIIGSIAKDAGTFAIYMLCLWFNHEYLGNSILVALTIIIMFFFSAITVALRYVDKRLMTVDEAIEFLNIIKDNQ